MIGLGSDKNNFHGGCPPSCIWKCFTCPPCKDGQDWIRSISKWSKCSKCSNVDYWWMVRSGARVFQNDQNVQFFPKLPKMLTLMDCQEWSRGPPQLKTSTGWSPSICHSCSRRGEVKSGPELSRFLGGGSDTHTDSLSLFLLFLRSSFTEYKESFVYDCNYNWVLAPEAL